MLQKCIRDDHAATCALAFQKTHCTEVSCTNFTYLLSTQWQLLSRCAHTMQWLGMYQTLAASRNTRASAHHNNAMMGWGYVLYRPLGFDSPFLNSIHHKTPIGTVLRQWLKNYLTASVGYITFLTKAGPVIRALLILQKEARSCTCLITVR